MSWWSRFTRKFKRPLDKGNDFISVVVFLTEPRDLRDADLRAAAERAWPRAVETVGDAAIYVVGAGPMCMVKADRHLFNIIRSANPYGSEREKFAESIQDLQIRRIILKHAAWFSVDYMGGPQGAPSETKYLACARLAAELIQDDCMGIYLPDEELILPRTPDFCGSLRSLKSLHDLKELAQEPILEFPDDQAAAGAESAKANWPEFVGAFGAKLNGDRFFVKKRFSENDNAEFMWICVAQIDVNRIFGVLESDPSVVSKLKRGEALQLQSAEVEDWVYTRNGKTYGGFLQSPKK